MIGPGAWQGDSRRARWRRFRARRILAAALACCAVAIGWQALAPQAEATRSVSVAAHDLRAGHRVTASDLTGVDWPTSAHLPGLLVPEDAVGRVLTAPLRAGEPVTASRVRSVRRWPGTRPGHVVLTVPVTSPALASALHPGDRVDVMARGNGDTLGTSLPVTRVHTAQGGTAMLPAGSSPDASILVSCTPSVAARIARALRPTGSGGVLLALHPGP